MKKILIILSVLATALIGFGQKNTSLVGVNVGNNGSTGNGNSGSLNQVSIVNIPSIQLTTNSCNINNVGFNQALQAEFVVGATAYEFSVSNAEDGSIQTIVRPNRTLKLSQLPNAVTYNTTYYISVRALKGSQVGSYGAVCSVTTKAHPISQINPSICGGAAVGMNQIIQADIVQGATEYHFRAYNHLLGYQEEVVRSTRKFKFNQFVNTPNPGADYQVQVRTKVGNKLSTWGPVCEISLSGTPVELPCFTDQIIVGQMNEDSLFRLDYLDYVKDIGTYSRTQNKSSLTCSQTFIIPVVVNVLFDGTGPTTNLTDAQILGAIQKLNDDFRDVTGPNNTCIEFCLAQNLPIGTGNWPSSWPATPGITRTNSSLTFQNWNTSHPSTVVSFPNDRYVNIWIVDFLFGALGRATLPPQGAAQNNGIIIRASEISNSDATLTHEMGHYLGLLHPFGLIMSSCNSGVSSYPLAGVETAWDYITDTPPQNDGTKFLPGYGGGCNTAPTTWSSVPGSPSCNESGTTQPANFMDYSPDYCKNLFTNGQIDEMHRVLLNHPKRNNLWVMSNLILTGLAGPNGCTPIGATADFTIASNQLCESTSQLSLSPVAPVPFSAWTYTLTDPNGNVIQYSNPSSPAPSLPALLAGPFNVTGMWTVSLMTSDGISTANSAQQNFFVSPCASLSNNPWTDWSVGNRGGLVWTSGNASYSGTSLGGGRGNASIMHNAALNRGFYTNGKDLWRSNNAWLTGVASGGYITSSSLSGGNKKAIIIPSLAAPFEDYYVVMSTNGNGLRYATVSFNTGFAQITSRDQAVVGSSSNHVGGISAVPHCNGVDYWILARVGSGAAVNAYQLTPSGFNGVVVTSPITLGSNSDGSIEINREGTKVAISGGVPGVHLYDFNNQTGELVNEVELPKPAALDLYSGDSQFSPSGDFLYEIRKPFLFQYDLRNISSCQPTVPVNSIDISAVTGNYLRRGFLQLGPDDKMYFIFHNNRVSIVNYPDNLIDPQLTNSIGLNLNATVVVPNFVITSLPNIVDAYQAPLTQGFSFCINNCNDVYFNNDGCGSSFLWDFGYNGITSTDQNPTFTYPGTGIYTVTLVVDGVALPSQQVVINSSPPPSLTNAVSSCLGVETIAISPAGTANTAYPNATYTWTINGGQIVQGGGINDDYVQVLWNSSSGGIAFLQLEDANGCLFNVSANQSSTGPITLSIMQNNIICNGASTGSIDLTVSGGVPVYIYEWSNGAITEDIGSLNAGTYSVTVTDASSCTVTSNVVITEPTQLVASTTQANVACNGDNTGSIDLTASGGTNPYSYVWSNGLIAEDIGSLNAGIYGVTVTDASSCTVTSNVVITEPTQLVASTTQANVACNGDNTGSIDLTASGGTNPYSYVWSNGLIAEDIGSLNAGIYSVTVTDANSCTVTSNVVVNEPNAPLQLSLLTLSHVSCVGTNSGQLQVAASGGTGPYLYQIQGGSGWQSLGTFSNLAVNTYTVEVRDIKGCTESIQVIINDGNALSAVVYECDNEVEVVISGGVGPYSIDWYQNNTNLGLVDPIVNLSSGQYTVEVTDGNGCMITVPFNVSGNSNPVNFPIHYPGFGNDTYTDIHIDSYGNTYVAFSYEEDIEVHGTPYASNACNSETMVVKYDHCNELVWAYKLPHCTNIAGSYAAMGNSGRQTKDIIAVDHNGNVYVQAFIDKLLPNSPSFGITGTLSTGVFYIFKFDSFGNPVLADDVNTGREEITVDSQGNVITLHTDGLSTGLSSWIINGLGSGNSFPTNNFRFFAPDYVRTNDVITDNNDDILVSGIKDVGGVPHISVLKIQHGTGLLTQLWSTNFAAPGLISFGSGGITDMVHLSVADEVVFVGNTGGNSIVIGTTTIGANTPFIVGLDNNNGAVLWAMPITVSGASSPTVSGVDTDFNDGIFVTGSDNQGTFFVNKYQVSGLAFPMLEWGHVGNSILILPQSIISAQDIAVKGNGEFYVNGYFTGELEINSKNLISDPVSQGYKDILVVKMDDEPIGPRYTRVFDNEDVGERVISAVIEKDISQLEVHLFPNPTRGQFTIEVNELAEDANVTITNLLGEVLVNKSLETKKMELDLASESVGVYMIMIKNGDFTTTKKLVLQK
ncbi:T9SS type A sorting domain-containing protein [Flavobacteriales bacterium]|nr:T9SS type A sorting domain-containing protein [Flavobacteriales bacterium]